MRDLALTFVIVCRCGEHFDGSTVDVAEMEFAAHRSKPTHGVLPTTNPEIVVSWTGGGCPGEAWRGWSVREVP